MTKLREVTVHKFKEKVKSEKLLFSGKLSLTSCDYIRTQSEFNIHLKLFVDSIEMCLLT
jgi:hypothetical protein